MSFLSDIHDNLKNQKVYVYSARKIVVKVTARDEDMALARLKAAGYGHLKLKKIEDRVDV